MVTILEYLLSDQGKSAFLYKVLEAFQLKTVSTTFGKGFEIAKAE